MGIERRSFGVCVRAPLHTSCAMQAPAYRNSMSTLMLTDALSYVKLWLVLGAEKTDRKPTRTSSLKTLYVCPECTLSLYNVCSVGLPV